MNFGSATQEQFTAFSLRGSFTSNAIDAINLDQNNDFGGNVNVFGAQAAAFRDVNDLNVSRLQTFNDAVVTATGRSRSDFQDVGGQLTADSFMRRRQYNCP